MAGTILNPYGIYPDPGEAFEFWGQPIYIADDTTAGQFQVNPGDLYCPGYVGPTFAYNPWDKVGIQWVDPKTNKSKGAQNFTPGTCIVTVRKERTVDAKKSAGADGETITPHGLKAAEVEIRITIWTPQQFIELQALWLNLFPGVQKKSKTTKTPITSQTILFGGKPGETIAVPTGKITSKTTTKTSLPNNAWDCVHPTLQMNGVKSLFFKGASGPDPGGPGQKVFTMHAVEYLPGVKGAKVDSTIVASKGSVFDPGKQPTPGVDPKNWAP